MSRLLVAFLLLPAFAIPAFAQEEAAPAGPTSTVQSAITLTFGGDRNAERRVITYTCETGNGFTVEYINAAPNFLALVPIEGETMIFNAVLSGSGARYTASSYEWWTQGPEATLRDLTQGEDAAPMATCSEFSNIP